MNRMAARVLVTSSTDSAGLVEEARRLLRTRPVQLIGPDSRRVRELVTRVTKRLEDASTVRAIRGHTDDGRLSVTLWIGDRFPFMFAAPSPGPPTAPPVLVPFGPLD